MANKVTMKSKGGNIILTHNGNELPFRTFRNALLFAKLARKGAFK